MNGQRIADETNKSYIFMWRGYKACISSQLPKLSSVELQRRYKLAMEFIKKPSLPAPSSQVGFTQASSQAGASSQAEAAPSYEASTEAALSSQVDPLTDVMTQPDPLPPNSAPNTFKKPNPAIFFSTSSSASAQSTSTSSSRPSSQSILSDGDEPSQIPETQFNMDGEF